MPLASSVYGAPPEDEKYWGTFGSWFREWLPVIVLFSFIVGLAIFAFVILTRPTQELWTEDEVRVWTAQLEHGREVTCIRLGGKHGISCDWDNVTIRTEIGDALVLEEEK